MHNPLPVQIAGAATIHVRDQELIGHQRVVLAASEDREIPVSLPKSLKDLDRVALRVAFLPDGRTRPQVYEESFVVLFSKRRTGNIRIDGDLADWEPGHRVSLPDVFKDFPVPSKLAAKFPEPVPWKGRDDLSATLYTCWDDETFYLAVEVRDDALRRPPASKGAYLYDSVQVYFDTLGDARDRLAAHGVGYDDDDYNYDLCPLADGLDVTRAQAPDWQVAFLRVGPAPEVRRALQRIDGRTVYEIALPGKQVHPIVLKPGSSFGFAVLINDNDNDYRKRGLTLTPAGTEPYMSPHLYPVLLLE